MVRVKNLRSAEISFGPVAIGPGEEKTVDDSLYSGALELLYASRWIEIEGDRIADVEMLPTPPPESDEGDEGDE